ncbi:hypothetical protein Fmac_007751 [Flemingia macrophylla]|uniref:RING-type E3 ubiquitin transferase n=1 Tax=Flemingia macrophylla TaxID=520843 RepID=A0ABD1MVY7_9FABA
MCMGSIVMLGYLNLEGIEGIAGVALIPFLGREGNAMEGTTVESLDVNPKVIPSYPPIYVKGVNALTKSSSNNMSLSPPRDRNNNINNEAEERTFHLYWCFQCNRTVRLAPESPSEVACPRCLGQFICEINVPRPRLVVDFTTPDPSPEARLLEALSLMMGPHPPIRRFPPQEIPVRTPPRARTRRRQPQPRTWIVFQPMDPGPIPAGLDSRDYFLGPGLNELIDQLTENDRPGPPPAPETAIGGIPTVKIERSHLKENSQCPVCQEEFQVGGEARELPCNHIYHSDCIVPWLRLHNSCPICRQELPVPVTERVSPPSSPSGDGRLRRCLRWTRLASLWPFHSRPPNNTVDVHVAAPSSTSTSTSRGDSYFNSSHC